ncbi:hypothetical protein [Neptunicella sp. SCSIO 80796]|uniref:hypothetical protein n=1 Tax=Neptunicella plasticusilytica TaxID=3117012 RepID=UPI003A4D79AC
MSAWQKIKQSVVSSNRSDQFLEGIVQPDENRGNRLCVSVSDIHLTDGTVGFQNLGDHAWQLFYNSILQRCKNYYVDEVLFVLDGDIVDMIRSSRWVENGIYPWERQRSAEFSAVINQIIQDIVEHKHKSFFDMLKALPARLREEAAVKQVKVVITLGNHDKELFCDQQALSYFYEQALGIRLDDISLAERQLIGRMYGDEAMFESLSSAPYMPFYYGDTGFRFFTTHGQWRDKDNSRSIKAEDGLPGWSASEGWQTEKWQQLGYSPFLLPCFGDSVAAGVLSTFIYKVKRQLDENGCQDTRLNSILDELDLYRPTYAALTRILKETSDMRSDGRGETAIKIIEETLYHCIIEWLSWDFTYQSTSSFRGTLLRTGKRLLEWLRSMGHGLEIKGLASLLRIIEFLNQFFRRSITLNEMGRFPAFMPEYRHYQFQIHGEGHTHMPLQEQPNIEGLRSSTYINFGTWRDQIVIRKDRGYRRQGVLRALYILDLVNRCDDPGQPPRTFDYFVEDVVNWGDFKDALNECGKVQMKF